MLRSLAAPHPPASREGEGGFTLVELLVVLTIIALAMAAVPAIVAGLPSIRLRTAADDMIATLRELHQQAIRRGQTTELILDPAARAYRVSTDPTPRHLPEIVAELDFAPTAAVPAGGKRSIRFFADGSASGGTVLLKNGERLAAINVDWLTGRVRRDE
jgi:general secretion pathway protein H